MTTQDFLWGASTAPHQIEGNNLNSSFWQVERTVPGLEPSGDACDSYHRYREDMELLAASGLNAYRFGVEWARIEPERGEFSRAELAHYRRMIDTALELGLAPVITLQHFTVPRWFEAAGGWFGDHAVDDFRRYVERVSEILDGVGWVITINEPNVLTKIAGMGRIAEALAAGDMAAVQAIVSATPSLEWGHRLVEFHEAARAVLRERFTGRVGWSIATQSFTATPGNEAVYDQVYEAWEGVYLEASKQDDFVGVQSYTSQEVDENGPVPPAPSPDNTLNGWTYRPDALGIALRQTSARTGGVPALVTENGISTADDERRIAYTTGALTAMQEAVQDGVDVRGYLHWSLLDNYEWGHWEPTFGLIAVDRTTFERRPKPSLQWLGEVARRGGLPPNAA